MMQGAIANCIISVCQWNRKASPRDREAVSTSREEFGFGIGAVGAS